ncbi:right-handed parallel beta-helix repeat-containing protein [Helicobacter pylori]
MRRVLKHHVCLCVLSTAVLASLALLTDQNKVYAQSQTGLNCKGVSNSNGNGSTRDNTNRRIECDGSGNGRGDGKGQLSGIRTIDMSGTWTGGSNSGKPAVKVYGADITINSSGALKIMDSDKSNSNPAIQVYDKGVLTVNNVTATGVYKGIVVSGGGSSVTVVKGSIEVRDGGGAVIEVSGGGDVTLNRGVKTVSGGGNNTGIEVGQGGGNVTVMGTDFSKVKTGIKFTGTGTASVMGGAGGATIFNLTSGGTGIKMEGDGRANATVMNMAFMGNRTATGAEVTSGTLTVNTVTMTNVKMGMKVTGSGRANVMGESTIGVQAGGTGLKVEGTGRANVVGESTIEGKRVGVEVSGSGILKVNGGATIEVQAGGTGLKVEGTGRANVMGGEIKGKGGVGSVGVDVSTSETVTLSGGVKVEGFETGMKVTKGTLKVDGGSAINFKGEYGVYVGIDVTSAELTGTKIVGGGNEKSTGVYAMGGNVTLEGVTVSGVEKGVVMMGSGTLTVMGGTTIDFKGEYGVYVGEKVTSASLKGTKIVGGGSGKGTGVVMVGTEKMTMRLEGVKIEGFETGVSAKGGTVTMNEVKVEGVEMGITMVGKGSLTISGESAISFKGDEGVGVIVGGEVTAELTGSKIVGGGNEKSTGVYAMGVGEMRVALDNVKISKVGKGVSVEGKGSLTISGGEISQVQTGVSVEGKGSLTIEKGTRIEFTNGYGVMVGRGMSASLKGTVIRGEGSGYGVYVGGGTVLLEKVRIEGNEKSTGLRVTQGAVWLKETTLRNVAKGLIISEGDVYMEGGSVEFKGEHGILLKQGRTLLTHVSMKYTGDSHNGTFLKVEADSVLDAQGKRVLNTADIKGLGIKMDGQAKASGVYGFV